MGKRKASPTIIFPVMILVDSSEQLPYTFENILSDAKTKRKPYNVYTERFNLYTGDYSLDGLSDDFITVERKSPEDFIGSVIPSKSNRTRRQVFEAEFERMQMFAHPFIVVESEWEELTKIIKERSNASPKSIIRTWLSWMFRYPKVHWCFVPGRRAGEVTTFRILNFALENAKMHPLYSSKLGTQNGLGQDS